MIGRNRSNVQGKNLSESRLIVGLGNPGGDYADTRHNLGFLAVQRLAERLNLKFVPSSFTNALAAEGKFEDASVCLLKPMTFMNNSGAAVLQAAEKMELDLRHLLVVCDDFNLDFAQIRLRPKGSDGGHNGLNSVIQQLGTEEFARLRLGIGAPTGGQDAVDYVLEEFSARERAELDRLINEAADCCLAWLREGVAAAMDQHNRKKTEP